MYWTTAIRHVMLTAGLKHDFLDPIKEAALHVLMESPAQPRQIGDGESVMLGSSPEHVDLSVSF